jgi:hypothetical protein
MFDARRSRSTARAEYVSPRRTIEAAFFGVVFAAIS